MKMRSATLELFTSMDIAAFSEYSAKLEATLTDLAHRRYEHYSLSGLMVNLMHPTNCKYIFAKQLRL